MPGVILTWSDDQDHIFRYDTYAVQPVDRADNIRTIDVGDTDPQIAVEMFKVLGYDLLWMNNNRVKGVNEDVLDVWNTVSDAYTSGQVASLRRFLRI